MGRARKGGRRGERGEGRGEREEGGGGEGGGGGGGGGEEEGGEGGRGGRGGGGSIGRVSLAKLRIDQLDRLYSKLRDEGGQDHGPLSPAMVRQAHAVIEELSCFRGVEEARAAIVRTDVPRDCGWSSKRGLLGSIAGDCSPVVSNVAAP